MLMQALRDASANRTKSIENQPALAKRERYTRMKVYYATDRARAAGSILAFGSGRGAGLSYGEAEVSIPDDHRMGAIERPHWWRLEFREDPERHVVLASMSSLAEDDFVGRARETLARSNKKQVLLFVHGYRVAFDDAVMRTAQLAYDIHFEGVAALYSWPSEATIPGYMVDATNVEWSRPRFVQFLTLLREHLGADEVHLVAHSMGNRLLLGLLGTMTQQPTAAPAGLGQVVFAAPDVDAAIFKQAAATLRSKAKQFTLYASSDDVALKASKAIQKYPRAGDSGQSGADLVIVDPVHTIDATRVDTSLVGHSYYGENRSVLADLFELIRKGSPPQDRFGLVEQKRFGERYWRIEA
jgi:esterase/lipase superfamily enzyme